MKQSPPFLGSGALAALLALSLGCGGGGTGTPGTDGSLPGAPAGVAAGAPTLEELKNATYRGLEEENGPITLVNGRWEGKPFPEGAASRPEVSLVRDLRVTGDLDADGNDEAAVLLSAASGGSGTFTYLAVVKRKGGKVENVGTAFLGDRVQIRGVKIEDGRIFVDLVQAGPEDAACCPGELATRGWALRPEGLTEFVNTAKTGRLSLGTIGGKEWVLRSWDFDSPAPSTPEVTLRFEGNRLAGKGGCNNYFASVTGGTAPGDLSLGPVGATRMACSEPVMKVEDRYFSLLGSVRKFGFNAGQLALSYEKDGKVGVMLFDGRLLPGS